MLVRRLGVRRGARAKSFPHFPVSPTTFFDEKRVAACCTRISEFCSSLIRFPVCMRSVCSRSCVSCFSFFSFTSSPVCDKTLWDSPFGVKAFVNVLHGALYSPIMRKKSMNCEVKVKAKIENSLCARYAQARVSDRSRKRRPHDRRRRKSQRGNHLDEGGVDKMRGGFVRKSPIFYFFFRDFEKYEKILLENLDYLK